MSDPLWRATPFPGAGAGPRRDRLLARSARRASRAWQERAGVGRGHFCAGSAAACGGFIEPASAVGCDRKERMCRGILSSLRRMPHRYLRRRQHEMQIPDTGFHPEVFINLLITPAFQQSIARLLLKERVPVRLRGEGWQEIAEFAGAGSGPVGSRAELAEVIESASALIYAWPVTRAHPIDALNRPVIRPAIGRSQFLSGCRAALQERGRPNPSAQRVLSREGILAMLGRLRNGGRPGSSS